MNQRIQELSNQAYSYASEQTGEFTPEFMGFYDKKFAELLIQQCVICAEREWIRNGDTEHNRAVTRVITSIKEHFGVESE